MKFKIKLKENFPIKINYNEARIIIKALFHLRAKSYFQHKNIKPVLLLEDKFKEKIMEDPDF